ncbi:hypothetical protein COCSADRAFT_240343 [Bipolaris sorokiniana ND90Pr]|nr:uncharacterized protein COCSADRAFT_240343 [Bipolaris sorokiniana ND90Pr]EMD61209.1 hypothetical protein COCSADRAFT_240343 [Bipolaris sorokiniana ND90Pr]
MPSRLTRSTVMICVANGREDGSGVPAHKITQRTRLWRDAQDEVPGGGKTALHPQKGTTTAARGSAPTTTKEEMATIFWVTKAASVRPDSQPLERRIAPQGFRQRPLLQMLGSFAPPSTWVDSQRYRVKFQVQAFANPFDLCPVGCGCGCAFVQSLGTLHDQH